VNSPAVAVGTTGCLLEPAGGLGGVHILSEKESQRGCRVDLDADAVTPGIQGFPANTTFEFGMCAQTDADAACEYVWSSDPDNNDDDYDHVRTTTLVAGQAFQLAWEDKPDGGDEDFNDLIAVVRVQSDADGDGLWDDWEQSGIDTNGDGAIDLDLPALGADPNRKDMFIEIDYMDCNVAGGDCVAGDTHSHEPKAAALQAVVDAFANAPVSNPDGSTGITLHIDVDDAIPHQENLSINDLCYSGAGIASFDDVKADPAYFGPTNPRRFAYRYALFVHRQASDTTASGCGELPGNDFIVSLGDWHTICIGPGPNDVLDTVVLSDDDLSIGDYIMTGPDLTCDTARQGDDDQFVPQGSDPNDDLDNDGLEDRMVGTVQVQAGTLMHEFGHTLQLCHGGLLDPPGYTQCNANRKPNYISIMSYAFQTTGIPPTDPDGAGPLAARIDYSSTVLPSCVGPGVNGTLDTAPAVGDVAEGDFIRAGADRTCDTTATGDDVQMVQSGDPAELDEAHLNETVGIGDGADNSRYYCPGGNRRTVPGIGPIDWNCDGDGGADVDVAVNVNDGAATTLTGFDDWANLRYDFQTTKYFDDGTHEQVTNHIDIDEPTHLKVLGSDLQLIKSDLVDPVAAGSTLEYVLTVLNQGPDVASDIELVDALPAGVTYEGTAIGDCTHADGVVTCQIERLLPGESGEVQFSVQVDADLVYDAGGPTTITNQATVNNLGGADLDVSNNQVSEDTLVVADADLEIVSFASVDPPAEVLVSEDVGITLRKVIANNGPSGPIDVQLTQAATAPTDSTVDPVLSTSLETSLGLDEEREVFESFTIHCGRESQHRFVFSNEIQPADSADTDPDTSNNAASVDLDVECVVPVVLNIKPGSDPNSLNPDDRGVISVAVLTTLAGEYGTPLSFDAAAIDSASVRFGPRDVVWAESGGASIVHKAGHLEDSLELDEISYDGDQDMVFHFRVRNTGIEAGEVEACIKGEWIDAAGSVHKFFGCDAVRTVP
jgi:uncharacterized repeat protein (TIGR01451 family)